LRHPATNLKKPLHLQRQPLWLLLPKPHQLLPRKVHLLPVRKLVRLMPPLLLPPLKLQLRKLLPKQPQKLLPKQPQKLLLSPPLEKQSNHHENSFAFSTRPCFAQWRFFLFENHLISLTQAACRSGSTAAYGKSPHSSLRPVHAADHLVFRNDFLCRRGQCSAVAPAHLPEQDVCGYGHQHEQKHPDQNLDRLKIFVIVPMLLGKADFAPYTLDMVWQMSPATTKRKLGKTFAQKSRKHFLLMDMLAVHLGH
jgi:hypothetical protein